MKEDETDFSTVDINTEYLACRHKFCLSEMQGQNILEVRYLQKLMLGTDLHTTCDRAQESHCNIP